MNLIAVPTLDRLPPGLRYMVKPGLGRLVDLLLLKRLSECSKEIGDCQKCRYLDQCRKVHSEKIDRNEIINLIGVNVNVTRFI